METNLKLTKTQAGFLRSIKARHDMAVNAEMSQALMDIAEEAGLAEDVKDGKVLIRVTPDLGSIIVVRPDKQQVDSSEGDRE